MFYELTFIMRLKSFFIIFGFTSQRITGIISHYAAYSVKIITFLANNREFSRFFKTAHRARHAPPQASKWKNRLRLWAGRRSPPLTTSRRSLPACKPHRVIPLEHRQLWNFTTRMPESGPLFHVTGNCTGRRLHKSAGDCSPKRSAFKEREVQVPGESRKRRAQVRSPAVSTADRSHRHHGTVPSKSRVIITVSKLSVTTRKGWPVSNGPTDNQA